MSVLDEADDLIVTDVIEAGGGIDGIRFRDSRNGDGLDCMTFFVCKGIAWSSGTESCGTCRGASVVASLDVVTD